MAVSKRLRFEILRRDNHKCRYCGATAPDTELRVDHVVPVALGGSDDPSNLVCACNPCNTGKSSVPADAPLVADVAADALRWARAMEMVAVGRAVARAEAAELHQQFLSKWNGWTYTYKGQERTIDLPGGWKTSVDNILAAGLEMDDLHELIDVAMGTRGVKDEFSYFCGCCWQRIRESHEHAAAILSLQDARNG
jgi:hypothetical protein